MPVIDNKFDPRPMPQIGELRALDKLCVQITWIAGPRKEVSEIVDLAPMINRYKVYAPIRDQKAFSTVVLSEDGEMLEWNDGRIDMPATNVEYLAEQQMTGCQFNEFLKVCGLTRAAAAAEFGRSLRCIQDYVRTEGPIPRSMYYACKGYEARRIPKPLNLSLSCDYQAWDTWWEQSEYLLVNGSNEKQRV